MRAFVFIQLLWIQSWYYDWKFANWHHKVAWMIEWSLNTLDILIAGLSHKYLLASKSCTGIVDLVMWLCVFKHGANGWHTVWVWCCLNQKVAIKRFQEGNKMKCVAGLGSGVRVRVWFIPGIYLNVRFTLIELMFYLVNCVCYKRVTSHKVLLSFSWVIVV